MSRSRNKAKASRARQSYRRREKPGSAGVLADPAIMAEREKYLNIFIILLLVGFGVYLSVLYFGHQTVPNSDFPAFVKTGHEFLAFLSSFGAEKIGSFKRAPGLGVLQVQLSHLVGGRHPELTAGWLLNAILYPLTILLLYLIAREFLGKAAVWFALLFGVNPWSLHMLREPIVETSLIFFSVLTLYSILKRWPLRYFLAAAATMIRYEGAALIVAAFLMDIIEAKTWRRRILALVYSTLASLPMTLWLVGMHNEQGIDGVSAMHYVRNYSTGRERVIGQFAGHVWQVGVESFFRATTPSSSQALFAISKCALFICLILAVIYMLLKKQWKVLAPLSIFVSYFFVHALRTNTRTRYAMPIGWLAVLLCLYGLFAVWRLINANDPCDDDKKHRILFNGRVPRSIVTGLQVILLIAAAVWVCLLVPDLPRLEPYSRRSASVPCVAMGVVVAVTLGHIFVYKSKFLLRHISVAALMFLMIVSNQFTLAGMVGNGDKDKEFKMLADWYVANAKPGEKMISTLPHVVRLFAPKYHKHFISTSSVTAQTPQEFVQNCYKKNITYIAWDSRIWLRHNYSYYKRWKIGSTRMLAKPKDVEPFFEFVDVIKNNERKFINIFRLRELSPEQKQKLLEASN